MKTIFFFTLLSLTAFISNAQYVTIPDSTFVLFLQSAFPNAMTGNQMDTTDSLITHVTELYCGNISLTNLYGIQFFDSLQELNCSYNLLTQLPTLPRNLVTLRCNSNQLTSLPALPDSLTSLSCENNELTSIPALPSSLNGLYCSHNQLTSLPALPSSLTRLDCDHNALSSLPNLPDILGTLYCNNNELISLPILPSYLHSLSCTDNPQLACLPYFSQNSFHRFEVKKNTQIPCLPKYIFVINPSDSSTYLPICSPTSGCPIAYNIIGNVHHDTSINCMTDSLNNGPLLSGVKMLKYINGALKSQTYTDVNGFYSFDASTGDSVVVQIDSVNSLFVSCPLSGIRTINITTTDTVFTNQNFGVECNGVDVGAWSIQGSFRPTRNRPVYIQAGDVGHQFKLGCADNVSGTVTTTIMGSANYVAPLAGALTPTSVVGKTLTYTITDFGAIDPDSSFNIIVKTDSNAIVGRNICIKTKVTTSASDINSANDSLLFCGEIVNSYDPNDKAAYPGEVAIPDSWITYTIRFQNTGTDTAYHIIIRDTLSPFLDESTFTYLDGSVKPIISLTEGAILFNYPHINLLDSFHNEPESHGWVQYKIKTVANLPHFAVIDNTASIYFDQNSPVVTNTTINEYVIRTSQDITSCDSANIHGKIYYTNQTIVDTLTNDGVSVVTTNLVIHKSSFSSQNVTSCDSVDYLGNTYYTSQTIRDTFSNILGCDSIVTTNMVIHSIESQTTLTGATIASNQANAQYQWLDCNDTYSIIASAIYQSYTASENGNFAVEVSLNGCLDTSSCVIISTLGVSENSLNDQFKIYPNPTKGDIVIEFENIHSQLQAKITSVTGEVIATKTVSNTNKLEFNLEAAKGIYFIEITTEKEGRVMVRVVKE
ncbi:MAG: hypothetical protein COA58_04985 [Bacteroidetes bacterium]|nr:MAG: hypothetical protein COA58_04985 [Bacteroidota bacterium]